MRPTEFSVTIDDTTDIYEVLPQLYAFVHSHTGHYAPSEEFEDAADRLECKAFYQLLEAIDTLAIIKASRL